MSEFENISRPPLVLLANDQEWSARSLETILGPAGFAVLRAYTGRQVLDLVRTAQPDLVILDIRLPDMGGNEVCQTLRDDPCFSASTPIILTSSGALEREQRLAAFHAGAWELASQPLDGEALLLKLNAFMRSKREADRLRAESLLDEVTGLYNMRGLVRRAREISAGAQRLHAPIACVAFTPITADAVQLDFRPPTLTDPLIQHLGAIVRRSGRLSDAIGRMGQAEFAIIAPATAGAGAVRMIQRLREAIESEPMSVNGVEQRVEIRAGYCAVPDFADSAIDAVEMLLRAATALRHLRGDDCGGAIKAFEEVPVRSAL
jgi:diguanylate cyclase (GGDEF)-like protein